MDRLTKAVVLGSAVAALGFETLTGPEIGYLPRLAVAMAIALYVLGRIWPERTVGVVLALGAVAPVLFILTVGHFRLPYLSVWKAALVGAAAATTTLTWHYPRRLRFPLVAWALAVAMVWPIVALRELDWTPALLWAWPVTPSSAFHALPSTVWIAQIAQVHLLPLLLVDWLFGRFAPGRTDSFEQQIVRPMLGFVAAAAAVAVFQGFVDLRFGSIGGWAAIGRATGALADANPSGSFAALWVAIPFALLIDARRRSHMLVLSLMPLLLVLSVWMTGSRTALLGALLGLAAGLHIVMLSATRRRKWTAAVAVAGVLGASVCLALLPQTRVEGPLVRIRSLLPDLSMPSVRAAARELWERNGYGLTAVEMIRDKPWQGVGLGAFHVMTVSYSGGRLSSDNAQNWYRHQLAELGLLGSIGWLACLTAMAAAFGRRSKPETRTRTVALRYSIIGFAAVSLIGMPGQNVIVALTFGLLVFWLLLLLSESSAAEVRPLHARSRAGSVLALGLAVVLAALTWHAGWGELRPPFRAKRFAEGYRYGLYVPFDGPRGETFTDAHAVTVSPAHKPWLKLSVWVDHPDADQRPVRVQVWRDHQRIVSGRFGRGLPLTRYVRVGQDEKPFVLETLVDRTFRSAEGPYPEVGLSISWEFVDSAPIADRIESE